MSFSITQKLVAAFLGLTVLILVATLGLARWSFQQGFLDYVNALEQSRLQALSITLAEDFAAGGGSWATVGGPGLETRLRRTPPHERRRPRGAGPPPRHSPPPPPDTPGAHRAIQGVPATALYDLAGQLIAGRLGQLEDRVLNRAPVVVNGQTVGELRSAARRQISTPLETGFSQQQLTTAWVIGLFSLALAAVVSLLLARGLLAPVKGMIAGVAQLSSGNYSHRINAARQTPRGDSDVPNSRRRSDELGQLIDDLDRLGSALEAHRSSRQRLLADVSHELRTPLTVLAGEIEALQDGLRPFDQAQLDSLDQEVKRLRRLVDDLYELSVSDLGGLRYVFEPVEMVTWLEAEVIAMQERAGSAGIALTFENTISGIDQIVVNADAQRLEQLLRNLLNNALAYTDAPGSIVLRLSVSNSRVELTVSDSPPGVAESELEQLFEPLFRRDESRSRRTGGAGLGLAICRNIVNAHGGAISAQQSPLGGVEIRIELPIAAQ